ncbi:MAG: cyclase family protein [Desulfomonilaceae bacterium]
MADSWQGWMKIKSDQCSTGKGPWMDLSQTVYDGMPRFASFGPPRVSQIRKMPQDPLNVTEIQIICHVGTHVDAPRHFFPDGPGIDQIPLDRFRGSGVVWRLDIKPFGIIGTDDLERADPELQWGDIVLLNCGWFPNFGKDIYDQNYSLSPEAANWMVDRGVKLVGVDCSTVDLAHSQRRPGFNWPIHRILLSHGVLIAEHLTNLDSLSGKRVEVIFLPVKIRDADGAPARVVAREIGR